MQHDAGRDALGGDQFGGERRFTAGRFALADGGERGVHRVAQHALEPRRGHGALDDAGTAQGAHGSFDQSEAGAGGQIAAAQQRAADFGVGNPLLGGERRQ